MTNDGRVVNTWDSEHPPGQSAYLLPNGHLLRAAHTRAGNIGGGEGGRIEEHDWEGNLVWAYDCADDRKVMHHDIEPLPNGNVLALVVEYKSNEECIAAGFDPRTLRSGYLLPEYVIEIEKVGKTGGKIVWEWHVWDHLIQDNDPKKPSYGKPSEHPELISVEVNGQFNKALWNHANSIDYNAERDEIMISARGCSELWVIDHSTTTEEAAGHAGGRRGKGGDLLYRWGNPAAYNRGTARDRRLFQQHDCQWVAAGRPGAGNILVYNNGLFRPKPGSTEPVEFVRRQPVGWSSMDETVPPLDAKGNYILEPGKAYGPDKAKWMYYDRGKPEALFSEAISGCERQANGNTLGCDGTHGVLFEVTPAGKKIWEYVCPVTRTGPIQQGDPIPLDHRGHAYNAVFKVQRYPADFPGFAGKDMTPKEQIVGSKGIPGFTGERRRPRDRRPPREAPRGARDASAPRPSAGIGDIKGPELVYIPGGTFEMGDHWGKGGEDPKHRTDERPLHAVTLDAIHVGKYEVTNRQYCDGLNYALSKGLIDVKEGLVYLQGGKAPLCEIRQADRKSRIGWDGKTFSVLDKKENHPMSCVYWEGAAAYGNWLSLQSGLKLLFDTSTWECDLSRPGFRLLTEAEWEYAARGGQQDPHRPFPWGDDENEDGTLANWPRSGDPCEAGPVPHTTPVGFYNGKLHRREDFGWPGSQKTYQTRNGANPWGLHDMSGNVWEWVYDWYLRSYYSVSPKVNPHGPPVSETKRFRDGKRYHVVRGGNWYNGKGMWGHGRTANRNPAFYRGASRIFDHHGFRVALAGPFRAERPAAAR